MSLVSHETVCERRYRSGNWPLSKLMVYVDSSTTYIFDIASHKSSLSFSPLERKILAEEPFMHAAQQGISKFLLRWAYQGRTRTPGIHPKELNFPPLANFSEPMMAPSPAPSRRQSTKDNHGERRIYISSGIGETARHAINPQKEDKSRRIDRSTTTPIKTPTKIKRPYFYSCNTNSIVKHPGRGQNFVKKWIKWASRIYWVKIQFKKGAFQTGSVKSSRIYWVKIQFRRSAFQTGSIKSRTRACQSNW
jgi:hypothetical protein